MKPKEVQLNKEKQFKRDYKLAGFFKILSTEELDTLYMVLARYGKTGRNGVILTEIEIELLNRIS